MSVYIRLVSLCMFFYEQIEIEKKEEEKNYFILCHGNQFEIQKEKKWIFDTYVQFIRKLHMVVSIWKKRISNGVHFMVKSFSYHPMSFWFSAVILSFCENLLFKLEIYFCSLHCRFFNDDVILKFYSPLLNMFVI